MATPIHDDAVLPTVRNDALWGGAVGDDAVDLTYFKKCTGRNLTPFAAIDHNDCFQTAWQHELLHPAFILIDIADSAR
jgi:hypothetical protein